MILQVHVDRLNKRRLIPVSLPDPSNIIGEVNKGFTFEGVVVAPALMPNPTLGIWYKDRDGHYYWGGGVIEVDGVSVGALTAVGEPVAGPEVIPFDPAKMSWGHKHYDLPLIWDELKTRGHGVTIAVIDTGVDFNHDDLKTNILSGSKSFVGNETDISDTAGHGTQMAGIIAASGFHKVYGVAPEAKLLIVKGTILPNDVNRKTFAKAILYAASLPEVDIVSISYSFLQDEPEIKSAVQKCLEAKKIVVAAIGNRRVPIKPVDEDTFPSAYNISSPVHEGVVSVGAFDQTGKVAPFSNWNNHLCFLSPGDLNVLTTGLNNSVTNGSRTSIATAFTSGCLAIMLSYIKRNTTLSADACVKALLDTCDDLGPTIGFDVRSGYGLMNFRNAIAKIKRP